MIDIWQTRVHGPGASRRGVVAGSAWLFTAWRRDSKGTWHNGGSHWHERAAIEAAERLPA